MSEQLIENVQEVENLTVEGGEATQGGQIRLVIAMSANAIMVDAPAEGLRVRNLPNYDANKVYTFNGAQVDGDFVLRPGAIAMVSRAHSNG